MELKFLIMMTRPQNITVACHYYSMAFLDSWSQLFLHQGCFGWDRVCSAFSSLVDMLTCLAIFNNPRFLSVPTSSVVTVA